MASGHPVEVARLGAPLLPRLTLAQAKWLGEGLVKWYTRVVHNGFPRSPKIPYLLGFLHPEGQWKRVPPSPPL
jgi:hypothetical protein